MNTAISFIKNMIKNYILPPETHIATISDENSVKPLTSEKEYAIIQTLKGSKNVARRGLRRSCYGIVRTKNKFSGAVKLNNGFLRLLRNVCRKSLFS